MTQGDLYFFLAVILIIVGMGLPVYARYGLRGILIFSGIIVTVFVIIWIKKKSKERQ